MKILSPIAILIVLTFSVGVFAQDSAVPASEVVSLAPLIQLVDASSVSSSQKSELKDAITQLSLADGFSNDPDFNLSFFKAVLNAMDAENQKKAPTLFDAESVESAYIVWWSDGPQSKKVELYFKVLDTYSTTILNTSSTGKVAMENSAKLVLKSLGLSSSRISQILSDWEHWQVLFFKSV